MMRRIDGERHPTSEYVASEYVAAYSTSFWSEGSVTVAARGGLRTCIVPWIVRTSMQIPTRGTVYAHAAEGLHEFSSFLNSSSRTSLVVCLYG